MATLVHASTVAIDGSGLLIIGRSGAGKSSFALRLMALGATLVADDQTALSVQNGAVMARAPTRLQGMIEARGIGLLRAPFLPETRLACVLDLDLAVTQRLPEPVTTDVMGIPLPLVSGQEGDHFPAAILCYLKHGRADVGTI